VERYVLTLDLVDDPDKMETYIRHHRAVWPEVLRSLRKVGVLQMEIYALGRRLTMVMDVKDGFDAKRDFARHNASDPRCLEWEELMKTFQQPPPGARPGEIWARMENVFDLDEQLRAHPAPTKARKKIAGKKAKAPAGKAKSKNKKKTRRG
jgi:L-rhamnose mutarotase